MGLSRNRRPRLSHKLGTVGLALWPAAACIATPLGLLACSATRGSNQTQSSALPSSSATASQGAAVVVAPSARASSGAKATTARVVAGSDDFRDAARGLDYPRAYTLIHKLPASELSRPAMLLARGRLALLSGHHAEAVTALTGLGQTLPMLNDDIERWRTEAAAVAGPYAQAAAKLASSARVKDKLAAAEAYLRAGDVAAARRTVDKAINRAQRNRRGSEEAAGHALRGRIAERAKKLAVAVADYRWLLKHSTNGHDIRTAIAAVDRLHGPLSVPERADALARSVSHDNIAGTQTTLTALRAKHPQHIHSINKAIADAYYRVRNYQAAVAALDVVANSPAPAAAEAKYYAARCAARLGHIDDALKRYAALALQHKKSDWAGRARYRRAELLLNSGRYAAAATAFNRYLSRHKRGAQRAAARYGLALSLLSAGKALRARKAFTSMRKKAKERRFRALLQHLEGVAAQRAGDMPRARKLWRGLIATQPLTWPAMAAHARLSAHGDTPPPLLATAPASGFVPLSAKLPTAVALLHSLGLDEDAERHFINIEQTTAEAYPEREGEALCQLYGQLSGARRRQQVANRAVALDILMRPPSAAERWAWQCAYPRPFAQVVSQQEQHYQLPAGLVYAIMRQESAFNTTARSPVGARGLMQLMPNTAARAAAEAQLPFAATTMTQPNINIALGAFYLSKLASNFRDSLPLLVAAYNAGPQAVAHWLTGANGEDADLWVARIPYRETRNYVSRVLTNLARYQYLQGGIPAVTPFSLTLPDAVDISGDAY